MASRGVSSAPTNTTHIITMIARLPPPQAKLFIDKTEEECYRVLNMLKYQRVVLDCRQQEQQYQQQQQDQNSGCSYYYDNPEELKCDLCCRSDIPNEHSIKLCPQKNCSARTCASCYATALQTTLVKNNRCPWCRNTGYNTLVLHQP